MQTTNGGIHVTVPQYYSASFETSTVNGGVHSDMPGANMARSETRTESVGDIGSGGPLVRLVTTNGGIHLGKS